MAETKAAPKCGTYAGYIRHYKRGEDVCEPCREAQREYMRGLRKRRPDLTKRDQHRATVRNRALGRLAERYPEEYEALLAEELRKARDG